MNRWRKAASNTCERWPRNTVLQYAIVEKLPGITPLPLTPVYENDSYAIYDLAQKK